MAPASSSSSIGDSFFYIFVQSGLPGVIITVTFAQLLPSIFSKQYPLPFLDIFGVHTVIRVALMIETIGIVKFVYVIFSCFKVCFDRNRNERSCDGKTQSVLDTSYNKCFLGDDEDDILEYEREGSDQQQLENLAPSSTHDNDNTDNEMGRGGCHSDEKQTNKGVIDSSRRYLKALTNGLLTFASFCLTFLSVAFLVFGIYRGYSAFGQQLHTVLQFVILFVVLLIVFYCEGLKIAIVSTAHLDHVAVQAKGGSASAVQIHQLLHPPAPASKEVYYISTDDNNAGGGEGGAQASVGQPVDHVKRFLLGR